MLAVSRWHPVVGVGRSRPIADARGSRRGSPTRPVKNQNVKLLAPRNAKRRMSASLPPGTAPTLTDASRVTAPAASDDQSRDDTRPHVWYACFGSNILFERFNCYLEGGRIDGMVADMAGAPNL